MEYELLNIINQGLQTFLSEGRRSYVLLHNSSNTGHRALCDCFEICLHATKSTSFL